MQQPRSQDPPSFPSLAVQKSIRAQGEPGNEAKNVVKECTPTSHGMCRSCQRPGVCMCVWEKKQQTDHFQLPTKSQQQHSLAQAGLLTTQVLILYSMQNRETAPGSLLSVLQMLHLSVLKQTLHVTGQLKIFCSPSSPLPIHLVNINIACMIKFSWASHSDFTYSNTGWWERPGNL